MENKKSLASTISASNNPSHAGKSNVVAIAIFYQDTRVAKKTQVYVIYADQNFADFTRE